MRINCLITLAMFVFSSVALAADPAGDVLIAGLDTFKPGGASAKEMGRFSVV